MDNISIKRAAEADIPVVENILLDAVNWLNAMGQPLWDADEVSWDSLSKQYSINDFYIAYIGCAPAGCMVLVDHDPFYWPDIKKGEALFIHKLAVKNEVRKSGAADALIDFAKKQCAARGARSLRLDTHAFRPRLRAFYERQGFVFVTVRIFGGTIYAAYYMYELPESIIRTERLKINSFTPADGADLFECLSQPEVVRYEPYGVFDEESAYQEAVNRSMNPSYIAVRLKESNKLIGSIYLAKKDYGAFELGYVFNSKYWRAGYATEACRALICAAFGKKGEGAQAGAEAQAWAGAQAGVEAQAWAGARRIIAKCNPQNERSWRLLERLGFRREGHLIKDIFFKCDESGDPIWQDTYLYALLRSDVVVQ